MTLRIKFISYFVLQISTAFADPYSRDQYPQPTEVMFHYGNQEYLLQNAKQNTVPKLAWDRFLVGRRDGTSAKKPFRGGLNMAVHPALCDYYGDLMLGKEEKTPWFMVVHLDPKCLHRDRVAYLSGFNKDAKFRNWFERKIKTEDFPFPDFKSFVRACYVKDAWSGKLRMVYDSLFKDSRESDCELIYDQYLEEGQFSVVYLEDWIQSFYVRTRECITEIEGTAKEVLTVMGDPNLGYWRGTVSPGQPRLSRSSPKLGAGSFVILVKALRDVDTLPKDKIKKLRSVTSASDIYDPMSDQELNISGYWIREVIPRLLDQVLACEAGGHKSAWNQIADSFLNKTQKAEIIVPRVFDRTLEKFLNHSATVCQIGKSYAS